MDDQSELAQDVAGPEVVAPVAAQEETTAETEAELEPGETPEEEPHRKSRRERERLLKEKLRADLAEASQQLAQERARAAKLRAALEADTPPKEADFTDPLEYAAARGGWHAARSLTQRSVSEAQEAEQQAQARVQQIEQAEVAAIAEQWKAQVDDAKTRYADFEQVVLRNPAVTTLHDDVAKVIATSEVGADVAYYIGRNPGVAQQLARLNPVEAARAIGRLEAALSLPKPRTETAAPPPVNPVKGAARAAADPDRMSYEDYRAARRSGKIR